MQVIPSYYLLEEGGGLARRSNLVTKEALRRSLLMSEIPVNQRSCYWISDSDRDASVSAFRTSFSLGYGGQSVGGSNEDIIQPLKFVTLLPHPTCRTSLSKASPTRERETRHNSLLSHQIEVKLDNLKSFACLCNVEKGEKRSCHCRFKTSQDFG